MTSFCLPGKNTITFRRIQNIQRNTRERNKKNISAVQALLLWKGWLNCPSFRSQLLTAQTNLCYWTTLVRASLSSFRDLSHFFAVLTHFLFPLLVVSHNGLLSIFLSFFFIIIIILSLREHPPDLKTPVLKLTNESKEGERPIGQQTTQQPKNKLKRNPTRGFFPIIKNDFECVCSINSERWLGVMILSQVHLRKPCYDFFFL